MTTTNPCCDKCHNLHKNGETPVIGCGNPHCPCHQTAEKDYQKMGENISEYLDSHPIHTGNSDPHTPLDVVEKNDAPEWKERFMKQFQYSATSGVLKFIEAEKTLSYEEGQKAEYGGSAQTLHKIGWDGGYQAGRDFVLREILEKGYKDRFEEGRKAGIYAAIAEAENASEEDYIRKSVRFYKQTPNDIYSAACNDLTTRLKALLPDKK